MFKATLIPIWIDHQGPLGLNKFPARPVLIEVETLGAVLHGQMTKLTTCSASVLPDEPFLLREKIRVRTSFRFADVEYTLSGLTVENGACADIAVDFDLVTRKRMAALAANLKEAGLLLDREQAAKPAPDEPQNPVSDAKPKPAKSELRRVRHEPPPGGIERRAHHRHDLEAIANLVVVNKGIAVKCQLLEISYSGCRVFMEVPARILEDTHVEVDFVGQGYPFRMSARVKVKTDQHVLGLHFEKMNARTRERLEELLKELREQCPEL